MHLKKKRREKISLHCKRKSGKEWGKHDSVSLFKLFSCEWKTPSPHDNSDTVTALMTIKKYSINLHFIHTNAETEGN